MFGEHLVPENNPLYNPLQHPLYNPTLSRPRRVFQFYHRLKAHHFTRTLFVFFFVLPLFRIFRHGGFLIFLWFLVLLVCPQGFQQEI